MGLHVSLCITCKLKKGNISVNASTFFETKYVYYEYLFENPPLLGANVTTRNEYFARFTRYAEVALVPDHVMQYCWRFLVSMALVRLPQNVENLYWKHEKRQNAMIPPVQS